MYAFTIIEMFCNDKIIIVIFKKFPHVRRRRGDSPTLLPQKTEEIGQLLLIS
jgi:hypothetical protein